jgi:hypothetical protein
VLFIVLSGGDDEDKTSTTATTTTDRANQPGQPQQPQLLTITVRDGAPVGGVERIEVASGERIHFRVVSDEPGEVHVHGYEVDEQIKPGKPVVIDMPADLEGGYEVELHGDRSGEFQIAELRVSPG